MRAMVETARLRISYGELPRHQPEMTLRGVSQGSICNLCRLPIEAQAAEIQFPDPRSAKVYVLHPECHVAWSIALRKIESGAREGIESQAPRPPDS